MRTVVQDLQVGFGGGLNTVSDDSEVAPNEVRQGANFLLNEFGAAVKRLGSQHILAAALELGSPIQAGYGWNQVSGDTICVVVNGVLYTGTYGAFPITLTGQGSGLATTGNPDMIAFENSAHDEVVFIADGGAGGISMWDGTTFTVGVSGTPVGITRLAVYNDRLYGITGEDQDLWWSTLGDGTTLGQAGLGGGQAIVRTFSNQRITALATIGQSLLMIHVGGVSIFTGWTQDDINISAGTNGLTSDVGTIAPRCTISVENEVFILSDRGFYSITETNGVQPISTKIDNLIAGLSSAALAASFAVHYRSRREVWFYISGLGVMVFQYRLRAWMGPLNGGYLTTVSACGFEVLDTTGAGIVLLGDEAGWIKQVQMPGVYLDNVLSDGTGGSTITALLQQHRMFCSVAGQPPSFEMTKAWRFAYLLFDPKSGTDITLSWTTAYGSGSYAVPTGAGAWGTGSWGWGTWGGSGVVPFRIPLGGRGNYIDFTIQDASAAAPLYSRLSLEAYALGRRG